VTAAGNLVIRTYEDHDLKGATKAYEREAHELARQGYTPISQSWSAARYTMTSARVGPFRPKGTVSAAARRDQVWAIRACLLLPSHPVAATQVSPGPR
jgi:hypothetical protein